MKGMIDRFGQSHFAIVGGKIYEEIIKPSGEHAKGGITGIDVRAIGGTAVVTKVEEGSSAAVLGVKTGWEILEKIERQFKDKPWIAFIRHAAVAGRLAGQVGAAKEVRFRDGSDGSVALEIDLAPQTGSRYQLGFLPAMYVKLESRRLDGNVGYIAFNAFMDPINVMPAFEKAVKSLVDCEGIIIDIRGNGGGIPLVAMGMAGWLIRTPDQYFGTMRTRDTEIKFIVNPRLETFDGPLALLIDGSSGSCAEIFAGGLRDMGRARLFGTRTAGAVLPAHWMKLPNGDLFFYPIADYFSGNGERLEGVGVKPDVEAPHQRSALLEGRDNALDAAARWILDQGGK